MRNKILNKDVVTPSVNLTDGLISVWEMDEVSGAQMNDSYGGNHGVINGATVNQIGKLDKAYFYNRTNLDDVLVPSFSVVPDITISIWVNTTDITLQQMVILKKPINTQWTTFFSGGRFYLRGGGTTSVDILASTYFTNNTWAHIICTIEGVVGKIYVDGVLANSGTVEAIANDTTIITNDIIISTYNGNNDPFNGLIDQTAVWNRALNQDEIDYLYNNGDGRNFSDDIYTNISTDLISVWEMDEVSGTTMYDDFGSNDGILTGGVTVNQIGKLDKAYDFGTGSNGESADVLNGADFSFSDGNGNDKPFSTSIWMYPTAIVNYDWLLAKRIWGGIAEYQALRDLNSFIFMIFSQGNQNAWIKWDFPTINISLDEWHHIVCTYDGLGNSDSLKIYLDGVLQALSFTSSLTYAGMAYNTSPLYIGNVSLSSAYAHKGLLDQTAVWKRALTQSDVSYLYNGGLGRKIPTPSTTLKTGLLALYEMDEASGTDMYDEHGSSDGIIYNDVTVNQTGKLDKSYLLGGVSSYLDITGITSTTQKYTMSFWINPTTLTASATGGLFDTTSGSLAIKLNSASFGFYDGTAWRYIYFTPNTGVWEHYLIIFDGDNSIAELFVNNVSIGTATYASKNIGGTTVLGKFISNSVYFDGHFDQTGIWERILTQDDIDYLYNNGAGRAYQNW